MIKKIPPNNLDAEESIIGAILLDNSELLNVINVIRDGDFYYPHLKVVYQSMVYLYSKDIPIDLITLKDNLEQRDLLEKLDVQKIANLAFKVSTSVHASQHAILVKRLSHERQINKMASSLINATYVEKLNILENIPSINTGQHKHIKTNELIKNNIEDITKRYNAKDDLRGLRTGFKDLDRLTDGFKATEVVGMWADSNVGKSLFASDIARNLVKQDKTVLFFAYEMSSENISYRVLADEMKLKIDVFNRPKSNLDVKAKEAIETYDKHILDNLHIYAEELETYTVNEIEGYIRLHENVDLIILDYLHLMETTKRYDSEIKKPAMIARELKKLARKYNVPIFVLMSQTKGPQESSKFVGTNELKHAVDQLWRLERNHEDGRKEIRQIARLYVVKGRGNKKGKVNFTFLEDYLTFKDCISYKDIKQNINHL